jgi:hypothetical protein
VSSMKDIVLRKISGVKAHVDSQSGLVCTLCCMDGNQMLTMSCVVDVACQNGTHHIKVAEYWAFLHSWPRLSCPH